MASKKKLKRKIKKLQKRFDKDIAVLGNQLDIAKLAISSLESKISNLSEAYTNKFANVDGCSFKIMQNGIVGIHNDIKEIREQIDILKRRTEVDYTQISKKTSDTEEEIIDGKKET